MWWWACATPEAPFQAPTRPTTVASDSGVPGTTDTADTADTTAEPPTDTATTLPPTLTPPISDPPMSGTPCGPDGVWGPESGTLFTVLVDTVAAPDAVCNDGSPGVYAVRPGTNQWVVFLDGGSMCNTYQGCIDRWCGTGAYDSTDMSSVGVPSHMGIGGLMSFNPENPFSANTIVYVHYCSSDMWSGAAPENVRMMDTGDTGMATDYAIRFNGADIVDAVFDELLATDRRPELADLPPASEMTRLFFGGSSAGGIGAILHADAVVERVHAVAPAADVRLGVVGGISPGLQAPSDPWGPLLPGPLVDESQALAGFASRAEEAFGPRKWAGRLDATCLAAHPVETWWCVDPTHVLLHEISTPFTVVHDQLDPVWLSSLDESVDGSDGPYAGVITEAGYQQGVRDLAAAMRAIDAPGTPTEYPLDGPLPAVFSPRCQLHDSYARNDAHYLDTHVPVDGGYLSTAETWSHWFLGIAPDDAVEDAEAVPVCP